MRCNGRELWHERSFDGSGRSAYFRDFSAHVLQERTEGAAVAAAL
jgi:hypothetical protein